METLNRLFKKECIWQCLWDNEPKMQKCLWQCIFSHIKVYMAVPTQLYIYYKEYYSRYYKHTIKKYYNVFLVLFFKLFL